MVTISSAPPEVFAGRLMVHETDSFTGLAPLTTTALRLSLPDPVVSGPGFAGAAGARGATNAPVCGGLPGAAGAGGVTSAAVFAALPGAAGAGGVVSVAGFAGLPDTAGAGGETSAAVVAAAPIFAAGTAGLLGGVTNIVVACAAAASARTATNVVMNGSRTLAPLPPACDYRVSLSYPNR